MAKVARGKALVAKLRAQPGVRDAEALAAWCGRYKEARKAGMSPAKAAAAAKGGSSNGADKSESPATSSDSAAAEEARKKRLAEAADLIGDPFGEDFGPNEAETAEERRQRKMEEKILREMEAADRAALTSAIMDQGGIQTRSDLAEEYRAIPNTFKRKDGLPGDEMADYLAMYYPELGIESENDLLVYFSDRYGVAA